MAIGHGAMWHEEPSLLMSWVMQVGFLICMGFFSVSLATGLYYAAELAEENSVKARKVIKLWLIGVIAVQLVLWAAGGVPFTQCLLGVAAHSVYATLLRDYPFAVFSSPQVILSVGMLRCVCLGS